MTRLGDRLARYDDEGSGPSHAVLPDVAQPTEVHEALVDLMDRVVLMASGAARETDGSGHAALAIAMRTLHKMRASILDSIAEVPEDAVRSFMTDLGAEIARVSLTGKEADDTRTHLPPASGTGLSGGGNPDREVHALGVPAD